MKEKKKAIANHMRIIDGKWFTLRHSGFPPSPILYDGANGRETALERLRSVDVADNLAAILVSLETELDRALKCLHLE